MGSRRIKYGSKALKDKRKSKKTTVKKKFNAASSGGGKQVNSKPTFTLADLKAFNRLPDKVRKASKKKIAAFQAAGVGVFEDFSVHTSGKGFGKFFDKVSPKYKKK